MSYWRKNRLYVNKKCLIGGKTVYMSIKMSYVRKNLVYVNRNVLFEEKPCICQLKCLI